MPLKNDKDVDWVGWLVEGLGGQEEVFQKALVGALQSRNMPKASILPGTVNMWWRKESRYIDVLSELDGRIMATVHIQPYGTSLWVGRAVEQFGASNYYKRMAGMAFLWTVDRCIKETVLTMAAVEAMHSVEDVEQ